MYREVTMIELKEVLRLRGEGLPKKRLAAQLGLDPKTVRRYLSVAASVGVQAGAGPGSGGASGRGFSPPYGRGIDSSIRRSRKRPRGPLRRAKPRGRFLVGFSPS